eukprot:12880735-Prorocentrum_lima.AAC.1
MQIHFKDGSTVKRVDEAKYLGCYVNSSTNPKVELRRRIGTRMAVWKRMDEFWLRSQAPQG